MPISWSRRALLPALTITALAACAGDEINAPVQSVEGTLTLDSSEGWAFASLAEEGPVTVADPSSSTEWDLAVNALNVMLNGGVAGPGGVSGYCLCQNAGATDEQVLAMTAESELADFEAVTLEDVPAGGFEQESLNPAMTGWYHGSGAAAVADERTWLLRLRNGTSFAKLRVVSLAGATATSAGEVTVEYAVQPTGTDPFGDTQVAVLDATSGATLDLAAGTVDGAEWDLALDGFTIRLNSGVSGSGDAAAAESEESFETVTTASTDPRAYRTDTFGGAFSTDPWYRYNLTGEHGVHPTFDVFLIRRGATVYKVQLLDYYGPAGEPRQITFRYASLSE